MKIRIDRLLILVVAVLLVGLFFFVTVKQLFFREPKKEIEIVYLKDFTNNSEVTLEEKAKSILIQYMDLYFQSISTLEVQDFTSLFSDSKEAYLNQTAISYLVSHHELQQFDMRLSKANYDIEIINIEAKDNILTVTFLENDYFQFNYINKESKAYGIQTTIKLEKTNDEYKILSIRKIQDYYVMFSNQYETKKNLSETKTYLDNLKTKYLKSSQEKIDNTSSEISAKVCDHSYNRQEAVNYSYKYITKRNDIWSTYDQYGGNCQNYVSQCLTAGGIPMDTIGNIYNQWKHYSSVIDEKEEESGRSYSWTTVGYFYDYVKNNTGYGLCANVTYNFNNIEIGDVAEVGYDNRWGHTVLIVDKVVSDNKTIDYLVNSNTVNLENYPLLAYAYPDLQFIQILGWNN